jgi:hypothetical protein
VKDELWQIVRPAIARLRASVMALVFGLFGGFGLFTATVWLVVRGGPEFEGQPIVGPHLSLLSNYYPGYSVTWGGAFVGFAYAAATGAVVGYALAWVYNSIAFRREKVRNSAPKS